MSGPERVLVAGVGNIFLGDDGFGVEVAQRLAREAGQHLPPGVRVADYGIRGLHLAYELLYGYDRVILVDAVKRGGEPGTLYVIEAVEDGFDAPAGAVDAHGMAPEAVLRLRRMLGGEGFPVLVVGCEPATVAEGVGLSPAVAQAVPRAIELVTGLLAGGEVED
ncbi:hydrogenase maturation protease, partial [Amycolatopsis rhizosphaerae]